MDPVRHSAEDEVWPLRPWIWALVCAAGAFAVHQQGDGGGDGGGDIAIWRQISITFIMVAVLAFVVTAEWRRLSWAVGFALFSASILAFVGWFTASYNKSGEIAEYPFLAGIFALLIAAPLFQTVRDEGGWRFPYARLHGHVWTDAVIGVAALAFTGISFLLAFMIGQLFSLIGIKFFTELLSEGWFAAILHGFAFGAALGLLRERDALVATLQKLVLVVFSVLAPVLALALGGFLLSLPFTGLAPLWDSGVPTTPVLLAGAAGAVGLTNAVIGNSREDGSRNSLLRWAAVLLSICILPLAIIAAISMGVRISQYGFTPDRIWGLIATIVACVYGAAYLVSAAKAMLAKMPLDWDGHVRPANIKIALGLCGTALFLAMPILDFGAMSARDQLARLKSGVTKAAEFDWRAMAFDFGPAGRAALEKLAKSGSAFERTSAKAALASDDRWNVEQQVKAENVDSYARNFSFNPSDRTLDEAGRRALINDGFCTQPCHIIWLGENRLVVVGSRHRNDVVTSALLVRPTQADIDLAKKRDQYIGEAKAGVWMQNFPNLGNPREEEVKALTGTSQIELRDVNMGQVFVDGKAVGPRLEK